MKRAEWKNILERATKRREAALLESEAAVAAYQEANGAEHALFMEFFADPDLSVADREALAPAGVSERERGRVPKWMAPPPVPKHGIRAFEITRQDDLICIWVNGEWFKTIPLESFIKAETKPKGAMSEPIAPVALSKESWAKYFEGKGAAETLKWLTKVWEIPAAELIPITTRPQGSTTSP